MSSTWTPVRDGDNRVGRASNEMKKKTKSDKRRTRLRGRVGNPKAENEAIAAPRGCPATLLFLPLFSLFHFNAGYLFFLKENVEGRYEALLIFKVGEDG